MWILGMNSENAKSSTFSARKTRSEIRTYPRKLKKFKGDSFADKQRFRQTVANFSPNVHFAPNLMKGDPDQSFKSFKILINPSKSANSVQFANLPPQPGPRRSEILRLWKLFKSLHILHNFMWVSRFRSDSTLQHPAAKISCFKIRPLSSLTGKMIFPFRYIPGGIAIIWNLKLNCYQPGMCGAAFYSAGRGKGKNPQGGAGRKSAQINQFKNFTKVRKI